MIVRSTHGELWSSAGVLVLQKSLFHFPLTLQPKRADELTCHYN